MTFVSDEEVSRYEAVRAEVRRRECLQASGIDAHLTIRDQDRICAGEARDTRATEIVSRWISGGAREYPVLVLLGSFGSGKTVAAGILLAQRGGQYIESERLCRIHTARYGEQAQAYTRCLRSGLLVVDELGIEERPELAAACLRDIVNSRRDRPTLLMGNLSKGQFWSLVDQRTRDRLGVDDPRTGVVVVLRTESLRGGQ